VPIIGASNICRALLLGFSFVPSSITSLLPAATIPMHPSTVVSILLGVLLVVYLGARAATRPLLSST